MKYFVHVIFGNELSSIFQDVQKYVDKYGERIFSPYFFPVVINERKDKIIEIKTLQKIKPKNTANFSGLYDDFLIEEKIEYEIIPTERIEKISYFFSQLFTKNITINNEDNDPILRVCLHLPVYKSDIWSKAKECIECIKSLNHNFEIDIIGYTSDTAFLFTQTTEELEKLPLLINEYSIAEQNSIKCIVEYKKKETNINHLILLQNKQSNGVSLNLDKESLTKTIGELIFIFIEHYNDLFHTPIIGNPTINALGIAILDFDKNYFIQYLLRRSYLHIMQKEDLLQEKVDVQKMSLVSNKKLEGKTNIFSNFYEKNITPRLRNKMSHEQIIVEVTPELDKMLDSLSEELQSFLNAVTLSIPEKRAALASLLGEDDELLSGYLFDNSQLIIDDCDRETANQFINIHNELKNNDDVSLRNNAILSIEKEDLVLPLDEIKSLKIKMKTSSTYIREKRKELESIDKQLDETIISDKRLNEDGTFIFNSQKFKLLHEIIEEQLQEDYSPTTISLPVSINLQENFPPIQSQGSQGSCTAFSVVSIYEYFAKKNKDFQDLSEAFVYYMSRKRNNKTSEDCGSSLYDAIMAMSVNGVCLEKTLPYNELNYQIEPNDDALIEAKERIIKKALNVRCDLNDFKSALANGYPVCISLKLFESFSDGFNEKTGFISRPTKEEISSGNSGSHAMVICGYNDENKVFIIRNSWGTQFGDKGYCYLPYSYIIDSELLNNACVITEVGQGYQLQSTITTVLDFDTTDNSIRHAILKNLINEEEYLLNILTERYNRTRLSYEILMGKLGNPSIRERLTKGKKELVEKEIEYYRRLKIESENNKNSELTHFDYGTNKYGMWIIIIVFGILVIFGVAGFLLNNKHEFTIKESLSSILIISILICSLFVYFPYRKRKRKILKKKLEEIIIQFSSLIIQKESELELVKLKYHIMGMILDRIFALQTALTTKLNIMRSFVGNLKTWYYEEEKEVKVMNPLNKGPFKSIISNEKLNIFFEQRKNELVKEIKLSDFINGYDLTEEGIRKFKVHIKETVKNSIFKFIQDFSIFNYVSQQVKYEYLNQNQIDVKTLFASFEDNSNVFVQLNAEALNSEPSTLIMINTKTRNEEGIWRNLIAPHFQRVPLPLKLQSMDKIILLKVMDLEIEDVNLIKNQYINSTS